MSAISPATLARIHTTFASDPEAAVYALAKMLRRAEEGKGTVAFFYTLTPDRQAPWLERAARELGGA